MSPIAGIVAVNRIAALYDRQQFYANRASQVKSVKTYQVGAEDKVTISPEAAVLKKDTAPRDKTSSRKKPEQAITYDNPRKSAIKSAPQPAAAAAEEPLAEAPAAV